MNPIFSASVFLIIPFFLQSGALAVGPDSLIAGPASAAERLILGGVGLLMLLGATLFILLKHSENRR